MKHSTTKQSGILHLASGIQNMISYNEALKITQKAFKSLNLQTEEFDLLDSVGRILGEDIYSDINLPPFDNSAMDGIAIKMNPSIKKWKVIGEIPAGKFSEFEIDEESAVNIMTGSMLPPGCDTVIPIEDIDADDHQAELKDGVRFVEGMNVRSQGQDLEKGKIALEKNTRLQSHHIAVAASCGKTSVQVYKPLKIGILATGDELVDIDEKPQVDKIRCSNLYSLLAAVKGMGMEPVNLGIARDDKKLIYDRMKNALENKIDILITTGGVSVGKYDYVKEIHEKLGINIQFHGVFIKPGKPTLFGTYEQNGHTTLVFGLPGNPVSSLVNFILYIQQNVDELLGSSDLKRFTGVLMDDLSKKDGKRHFMRGIYTYNDKNGTFQVRKMGSQSSGNLAEMGKSNCLIIIEEERRNPRKGEHVECIMI